MIRIEEKDHTLVFLERRFECAETQLFDRDMSDDRWNRFVSRKSIKFSSADSYSAKKRDAISEGDLRSPVERTSEIAPRDPSILIQSRSK